MKETLLGELTNKFAVHPENIATESLSFVLKKSDTIRKALTQMLQLLSPSLAGDITYNNQVFNEKDKSIPDFVGYDKTGNEICIIEAKFNANLTDKQPITYLRRLNEGKPTILLFLSPENRVSPLWLELLEKLSEENINYKEKLELSEDLRAASIHNNCTIGIISWPKLLGYLIEKAELEKELSVKSDLEQIFGLYEKINSEIFSPIKQEELSPLWAKRFMDYSDLVDDIVNLGIEKNLFTIEKLRAASKKNNYYRYIKFGKYLSSIVFDTESWFYLAHTPIWIEIYGKTWNNKKEFFMIKEKLKPLKARNPSRLFDFPNEPVYIPLYLKCNFEKHVVLENIFNQINEIDRLLNDR